MVGGQGLRATRDLDSDGREERRCCYGCGRVGHLRRDCQVRCFACDEIGHVRTQCPKRGAKGGYGVSASAPPGTGGVSVPLRDGVVGNCRMRALIDTGSSYTLITERAVRKVRLRVSRRGSTCISALDGRPLQSLGTVRLRRLIVDGVDCGTVEAQVMPGLPAGASCVVGLDVLGRVGLRYGPEGLHLGTSNVARASSPVSDVKVTDRDSSAKFDAGQKVCTVRWVWKGTNVRPHRGPVRSYEVAGSSQDRRARAAVDQPRAPGQAETRGRPRPVKFPAVCRRDERDRQLYLERARGVSVQRLRARRELGEVAAVATPASERGDRGVRSRNAVPERVGRPAGEYWRVAALRLYRRSRPRPRQRCKR